MSNADEYRYVLHRSWLAGDGRRALFVMLNPSTADEFTDDPTVRRCIGFATRWGLSGVVIVNLYGLRATNPADLRHYPGDKVGPDNDRQISYGAAMAAAHDWPVIVAWGASGCPESERIEVVMQLLDDVAVAPQCLGTTLAGHPRHPLYVPYDTPLQPWSHLLQETRLDQEPPNGA